MTDEYMAVPKRRDAESMKEYARRLEAHVTLPVRLPEEHALYFDLEFATLVDVDLLDAAKVEADHVRAIENAMRLMVAAMHGGTQRRAPITVSPTAGNRLEVIDGNATFFAIRAAGWKSVPVRMLTQQDAAEPQGSRRDR